MSKLSWWNCFPFGRSSRKTKKRDERLTNNSPKIIITNNRNHQLDDEQITGLLNDATTKRKYHEGILNAGEEDEMKVYGYKKSTIKTIICYFFIGMTLGLLRLIMHWWSHWLLLATHRACPLDEAEQVLIEEKFLGKHTIYYVKPIQLVNEETVKIMEEKNKTELDCYFTDYDRNLATNHTFQLEIHLANGTFRRVDSVQYFICKKLRYIWDVESQTFQRLRGLDVDVPSMTLHTHQGISSHTRNMRRLVYGDNMISVPVRGILTLLFLEALNPFYVFQVFSVILWFTYNYYYYATVIIIMSVFGITVSIIQTKKNQEALYSTVSATGHANVIHEDTSTLSIDTKYLVPGDVLEIPSSGCTMQCDAVLLSGNCILDESMLTGESVPVTKTPLPCKRDLIYDFKEHARHTLYCGTKVIQTRYIGSERVLAVVINTGNITAKGGLIRSILYPPPVDYKFEQDSYKFVALLALMATVGFVYTLVTKIMRQVNPLKIVVESLDLITVAVPPALPAAMSVGRMYAQSRLEKKNIYCISPRSINVSGSIDCVCFDKTGTLTEDGLDMYGVVPKTETNTLQMPLRQIERLPKGNLLYGMVTCHSITLMNGERKGDPLDLKMFESTGWILEEANVADENKYELLSPTTVRPPNSRGSQSQLPQSSSVQRLSDLELSTSSDIGIVREFPFSSSLQRMSVITRRLGDSHFNVYCKGSPEMIATLCLPETIPMDFNERLNYYAQQGYRIIAIAYKSLDKKMTYPKIQRISREKIESNLEFQGFVILENRLKNDSEEVIKVLNDANIRTIMVTGDNILTAVSVAKDCDMIKEDQSIIIVNFRYNKDDHPELYYTLEGHSTSATANLPVSPSCGFTVTNDCLKSPDDDIDKGAGDTNYKRMTISNSVSSMSTIETNTNSLNSKDHKDIESGGDFFFQRKKIKQEYNPYNLAPELPSNRYRFAMDGKTWAVCKEHYPELLAKFVTRGTIFARMSPDQKQALITELQDIGYYVAMCGDGANDCGALKSAHTGISLSEAESSVASPFTSKTATIACVPTVIREGRTALVTSFGIFKYMAAYSLVQFTSVLILYSIDSNLTDWQYLYIDLFMISIFAFFFGKTESYDGPLVKETPLNSLISLSPVVSLILQFSITAILQVGVWFYVQAQPWFVPFVYESESAISEFLGCHQNYAIFAVSSFQYIALAVVFSKGKPYRKTIFSNKGFLLSVLINTAFAAYIITIPNDFMIQLFHMVMPKVPDGDMFRLTMLGLGVFTFVAALLIEIFVVEMFVEKKLRYYFHNIEKSEKKYLSIENYLRQNAKWPPLSLYNNQENNSPDESPAKGGDSGASKTPEDGSKDNDDDDTSPMSYAEISIEPIEDDNAVYFDRNSSILASFFERERSRLNSTGPGKEKSEPTEKLLNGHDDVFTDYSEIKRRNQQLKHEYLEMQFNDTIKGSTSSGTTVNGFHSNNNGDDNNRKLQEDATTNIDNSVELKQMPNI